ncbi:MAG: cyclopropane-fatty-acyl-phospholipid synthase family protein [Paraburkholderia tropica]|uniref:Cyclopropane-fatty-acyl-phospholipid synthase n=1 Tax=Paraburkholderia tropica TaxID=92647 RepID=A0ABX5MWD3_9BURK|nr:cyclopropane-fatty-acyl-phospholipid synthase family protein [Paraburkholderia tropica]MDE1144431.1 cyclopropane-fatty-acyl-phospholipid synthase [Paraburkholderia tropica]PXX17320.1 cyclopropane-fatty-acyl-phospholipid synthase [Paraburkholderia tropica]PZW84501.1 cyclopropane-fatty-acyl-phospholipid synthase [Paraburkholderia tropica]
MTLLRLPTAAHPPMPLAARLFLALLRRIRHGHLTLTTPDGAQQVFGDARDVPAAALRIHDWRACRAILRAGDIGFAEALRAQWLDTPDLTALMRLAIRNEDAVATTLHGGPLARVWYALRHRLRRNTRAGSRRNIHAHYDLGNAFYAAWLDETMTYSSACFDDDAHRPLDEAQCAKYQRIIDTLALAPGMRVLEIGCGWGGFALYAARQGIHVRGVTISQEQHAWASERVNAAQLAHLAEIELRDYRDLCDVHDLHENDGQYDAIVSIEMFEAVGEAWWPTYFDTLSRLLKPGARALVQTITIDDAHVERYRTSSDFIREMIFPGGMLPGPQQFVRAAQQAQLEARAVFAFGRDYAQTLRLWRASFESRLDTLRALGFDDAFIRIWTLYFGYCEAAFDEGRTDVMHFVVQRCDGHPRADPRAHPH